MTVRLSQLANVDWKSGVPNAKGELNNKNIDNLRYIIENIDHTGARKSAILGKCWKYVSKLESPDEIIQATSLLMPRFLNDSPPSMRVKFKNHEEPYTVLAYEVQLLKILAPNIAPSSLTFEQFHDIINLFNNSNPQLTAERMLGLEALAVRAKFTALKNKIDPLIEKRITDLLESKTPLTAEQKNDLIVFLASMSVRDRIFERAAKLILGDCLDIDKDKFEKLLKTLNVEERDSFIGFVSDFLKDKDDNNYFYTHRFMDDAGLYKHKELKEGIPFYAWDKLLNKSEYLKTRDKFKKEPLDRDLLYILLRGEFPEAANYMPIPIIDKNNISEIVYFLDGKLDFDKTKTSILKNHLARIIDSLNPKNRSDFVIAVNINNYLSRAEPTNLTETLQKLFNKELEERQELSFWESIISKLVTFLGLAIEEWVKVDKNFLLETLKETPLDLKLSATSYEELWPWITKQNIRSIDLSNIPDIPDDLIVELPLSLEHINLSGNKVITEKIVEHIKKMEHLKSINISNTNLSDKAKAEFAVINSYNGVVDLRSVKITDELIKLIPLDSKRILFGNCSNVSENGFAPLLNMPNLEHLELGSFPANNPIYLRGVLNLPKLTSMKLTGITTDLNNIQPIISLHNIQNFELDSCEITGSRSDFKSTVKVLELTNSSFHGDRPFYSNLSELKLNDILFDKYTFEMIYRFADIITVKSNKEHDDLIKLAKNLYTYYSHFMERVRIGLNI